MLVKPTPWPSNLIGKVVRNKNIIKKCSCILFLSRFMNQNNVYEHFFIYLYYELLRITQHTTEQSIHLTN